MTAENPPGPDLVLEMLLGAVRAPAGFPLLSVYSYGLYTGIAPRSCCQLSKQKPDACACSAVHRRSLICKVVSALCI